MALPLPLVKASDGKWAIATQAGFEEILNRRVGENELQAIQTTRDCVTAQREYASVGSPLTGSSRSSLAIAGPTSLRGGNEERPFATDALELLGAE